MNGKLLYIYPILYDATVSFCYYYPIIIQAVLQVHQIQILVQLVGIINLGIYNTKDGVKI